MMAGLLQLVRCRRGASGAEMALIAPVLGSMLFVAMDLGLAFWSKLQLEQAAQRALALLATRSPKGSQDRQDAADKAAPRVSRRAAGNEVARAKAASESFTEPTRRKPRTLLPD